MASHARRARRGGSTAKRPDKKDVSGRDVGRPRLGQPRARLPHGRAAPAHAGGDRARPPRARPGPARARAHRLAARPLRAGRPGRARRARAAPAHEDRVEGEDPLAGFAPTAAQHLLRTDGFAHVADIMVGSFYDPELDEGCAFEELISFHGGLGGPQTRPFVLYPSARLAAPAGPLVGAAAVHALLAGWRSALQPPAGERAGARRRRRVLSHGPPTPGTGPRRCVRRRAPPGRTAPAAHPAGRDRPRPPASWPRSSGSSSPSPPGRSSSSCTRSRSGPREAPRAARLRPRRAGVVAAPGPHPGGPRHRARDRPSPRHRRPQAVRGAQDRRHPADRAARASSWPRSRRSASASCSGPRRRSSRSAPASASSPCACCARTPPTEILAVVAASGSFAAISFIFGSPLVGAVILIEAAALDRQGLRVVLPTGLLAAGVGSLVSIGMGSWTGLSSSDYALGSLSLPVFARPDVTDFLWTIPLAVAIALGAWAIFWGARALQPLVERRLVLAAARRRARRRRARDRLRAGHRPRDLGGAVLRPGPAPRPRPGRGGLVGRSARPGARPQERGLEHLAGRVPRRPDVPGRSTSGPPPACWHRTCPG